MDSDEENDYQPSWRGVPGIIILINVFENSKHNIFDVAHVATCRLIKQHMRSSSSHNIAVCLYGVEESSTSKFDIKPVMELIPLSVPTLDDYKKLKTTNTSSFTEAKKFKLSDVLWHCSKMFANCKKQLSARSVIMLTRLDVSPITEDQKATLSKASDLIDSNIDIRVINISDQEYTTHTYYEKFLKIANRGMDYILPKPIWSSAEIENLMHQESHRHLAVAKLNFEVSKDFNIGVGIYTLLRRPGQNYKKNVNLDRDTNAVLTSVTKTTKVTIECTEDDEEEIGQCKEVPLIKSELLFQQEFGGEMIEFTDNEMKAIKNPFGPPMMKLIGFKPTRIICKEKWYLKMGYFLFPNEKTIEGSTVAFRALHKACMDMQMVAICILCTRVNSKPVVVALCPCIKPLNLDIDVGFDVVHIPFVESVRDVNINEDDNEEISIIEKAHKTLMRDILNELVVEYKPDLFEDPKIQSKYRAIEAIALDEEDCDPFVDTTQPKPERFENIRDDLFEELFGPFGEMSLKRAASKQPSQSGKKQKVDDIDEGLLENRLKNKRLDDYSVPQLKQILKFKQIKNLPGLTGLKKKELVELVYKYCD